MDMPKEISILYRKMNMELNERLSTFGISNSQVAFLRCLNDNGEMTQVDLCHYLDLDKSSVTKSLLRMEAEGLITKRTTPNDTRSFLVSLTPKAKYLVEQTDSIVFDWANDVTAEMTEIEKEAFCKLLCKASARAKKICEKKY